jgi:DNA invertase Pin-like site-specific DNA recombinase
MGKLFAKKGVILHLVAEGGPVDLLDPAQEMLFHMRASMGRFERRRISINTRFALARKRDLGQRISGRAPFGFSFTEDGKITENPDEQKIINRILELRGCGFTIRAIQSQLKSECFFNRMNKPIGRNEIWTVIKRPA